MNKKQLYSAPEAELLVVRFEENFCQSPAYGQKGAAGGVMSTNDYGDGEEDLF